MPGQLSSFCACALSLAALAQAMPATTTTMARRAASAPSVTVKNGTYTGVYSADYDQDFFLGMPYAQPPPRFTLAQPLNSTWNGSRDATAYPPECVGYGSDDTGYTLSEDCLYLNVIRPAGVSPDAALPVAVWIHGGGLVMGGSADKRYNLSFIVETSVEQGTPMIGVSINYRLTAYGFLTGREAMAAGISNNGFRDQRQALRWVNENIAAFGGSPDKVTIWGESSGAESMMAQTMAFNGRDDGLFRGVIAESGFGGIIGRFPGGFNATADRQNVYDILVTSTSCAATVNTSASLDCLRALPFDEINAALNGTSASPWAPVIDGDFLADYPSNQLRDGRFLRVPVLIGCNTDEGMAFGTLVGPNGTVNTDADVAYALGKTMGGASTGAELDSLVAEAMAAYPNDQAVGIPGLDKWPVVVPGDALATTYGVQFRRTAAFYGDYYMHYTRRRASLAWSQYGIPSWSFRFDVVVNGVPRYIGATHFQEVAFAFRNLPGDGYATNPFAASNTTSVAASQEMKALAGVMSSAWVNFIVARDPNGAVVVPEWPVYNASSSAGTGVGSNMVWAVEGQGSHVETDDYRREGIAWFIEHGLSVFGN